MENQFLCDIYRADYEQYLRQSILFCSKVNVMYPDINYSRDIDKEHMEKIKSKLKQYEGFDNINLIPMKGESDRHFNYKDSPILFDTICKELYLTEVEKNCFIEYWNQEFDYLMFNGWAPWREFCSYMHEIFNIVIAYTDMMRLFCQTYSQNQGNVLSNSDFLYNLLASNVMQEEMKCFKKNYDESFNTSSRCFSGKYCEQCKKQMKIPLDRVSPINVKEKAIEILMPDYSEFEIDDLYEVRLKANSEIEQLADYIEEISLTVQHKEELDKLVRRKINPSVSELRAKVEGLHLTSVQKALSLKDIAAIPILVELMPNLPAYVPISLSAAFIMADIGIDIKKEYLQLKQDPLYFTIKLNKVAKRKNKRR